MNSEVLIAMIGGGTTLSVAALSFWQKIRLKRLQMELSKKERIINESDKNFVALVLLMDFELVNNIKNKIDFIFQRTKIDRFLLQIAVNGKVDFNVVSVIFEQHKDIKKAGYSVSRYSHLYVDDNYRSVIKRAEKVGQVYVEYDKMEDCYLKQLYKEEGITSAIKKHVYRIPLDSENDMVLFCSLSTKNGLLSDSERNFIHGEFGMINESFKTYFEKTKKINQ